MSDYEDIHRKFLIGLRRRVLGNRLGEFAVAVVNTSGNFHSIIVALRYSFLSTGL